MANGQNIDYSEKKKKKMAQGLHLPLHWGLNTIIFKYVYWYMQQISGERLQDHWSSCIVKTLNCVIVKTMRHCVSKVIYALISTHSTC